MNRGAFERQLSRLDEAVGGLRLDQQIWVMRFATCEEIQRLLELFDKRGAIPERWTSKTEDMAEICDLFARWNIRFRTRLGQD